MTTTVFPRNDAAASEIVRAASANDDDSCKWVLDTTFVGTVTKGAKAETDDDDDERHNTATTAAATTERILLVVVMMIGYLGISPA